MSLKVVNYLDARREAQLYRRAQFCSGYGKEE